jgi:hypothetical protein
MKKVIKKLFQIRKENVYSLLKSELIETSPMIDCNIVLISRSNFSRVLDMRDDNVIKEFKLMLQDNQIGVFAEINGKIVSHAWLQIGKVSRDKYNGSYGKLKDNEALIHFCNTSSEYRGNNLYPSLICELAKIYFKEYPSNIIYITTNPNNYSSQKGLLKVGFKYLEYRLVFKIFKYIKFEIKAEQYRRGVNIYDSKS